MDFQVFKHRSPLCVTKRQLERGRLTIGFLGGSITEPVPRHNWGEGIIASLLEQYPGIELMIENAAIGGTGSDLAVFRAEREIIRRGCDLIFVEYAVNDLNEPAGKRQRSREGLLRKLLKTGKADVVLAYTYHQLMYEDMTEGRIPPSIADFELLAEYYGINSVWMGWHAMQEVRAGKLRWDEWLPDGLHPTSRGSWSYAQAMSGFLQAALTQGEQSGQQAAGLTEVEQASAKPSLSTTGQTELPPPLDPECWEFTTLLDWSEVRREGPWTLRRWEHVRCAEQGLITSAPGARLSFAFKGKGLVLGFDFGKKSAEFRYRLDDGDWVDVVRERAEWCPEEGWYRPYMIGDDLGEREHRICIEVVHGNRERCQGTDFHLLFIGIVHEGEVAKK